MKVPEFLGKNKDIERLMHQHHIYQKDIQEKFIKSSGPGGQNVNKVSSCVVLHHVPTGQTVKCQSERTQAANRKKAFRLLIHQIAQKEAHRRMLQTQRREKEKRKNRKRPPFLKEEILQNKHVRSEKKKSRRKMNPNKIDFDS